MKNLIIEIISNKEKTYIGNLKYYFRLIFSAPNVTNPYHNFRHMMHVMCHAYEGGIYEKISQSEMRALLIAAMFHDYGHSGQMGNDAAEVANSIKAIKHYILDCDEELLLDIEDLIYATQWPHRKDMVVSRSMKIIRDADFTQVLSDTWLQQTVFGLAKEFNIPTAEFIHSQVNFISSLEFQSDWGKDICQPKVAAKIAEAEEFVALLIN